MQDDRLSHLSEDAIVDLSVFLWSLGNLSKCAARHDDELAAHTFDRFDLLLVRADDIVESYAVAGAEMVGANSATDERAGPRLCCFERAADQFSGADPVEAHTALCGIHRFGDSEAEIPKVMPECDGALPVDRSIEPGIDIGERVGDHVGGSVGDAVEDRQAASWRQVERLARGVRLKAPAVGRKRNCRHNMLLDLQVRHVDPAPLRPTPAA